MVLNFVRCAAAQTPGKPAPMPDDFSRPVGGIIADPSTETIDPPSQSLLPVTSPLMLYNPGTFEDIHKKCKEVFPICFNGANVMINKGLSNHFQVSHTLKIDPTNNSCRFGAVYVGKEPLGQQNSCPVMAGDTDFKGNASATIIYHPTDRFKLNLSSRVADAKIQVAHLAAEYRGSVATSSLAFVNTDLISGSGIVVGSYFRRLFPYIDLGAECMYQYGHHVPGRQNTMLSCGIRYISNFWTGAATIGAKRLHLSYYHKQRKNMQFGVEWETDWRMGESIATFGYQFDLPAANVTFKAQADTNGSVGAVLEKKLAPLPFTFTMSGVLDHINNTSKIGVGLIVLC